MATCDTDFSASRIHEFIIRIRFTVPIPCAQHLRFLDGLAHGQADDKAAPLIDFAFRGQRAAVLADDAPAK